MVVSVSIVALGVLIALFWGLGPHFLTFKTDYNLLFTNDTLDDQVNPLILLHFLPSEQRAVVVNLDPSIEVELIGGYGFYKLRAVAPLLKLENKDSHFVTASYSFALDRLVDSVIMTSGNDHQVVSRRNVKLLIWQTFFRRLHSKAELVDLMKSYFFLQSLSAESVDVIQASDLDKLNQITIGGSPNCSLAVINTTKSQGLATRVAQVIENSGGTVVRLTDSNQPLSNSSIYYSEKNLDCLAMTKRLKVLFPSSLEVEVSAGERELSEYRADLVIFLGQDLSQTIY